MEVGAMDVGSSQRRSGSVAGLRIGRRIRPRPKAAEGEPCSDMS
jgi:hypothetical protein